MAYQKFKMKIALDISPLQTGHKVRGVGFYIENLKSSFQKYFPEHDYTFFTNNNEIPNNIDIVHYPYFEPFLITLPVIKKNRTVVTVHDLTPILYPHKFPPGIKGLLRWQIQKILLRRSNAIITDSFTSQKDIAGILKIKRNKINVTYLAASEVFRKQESGKWRQTISNKYNLPEKFVLYVGDVTWNKNLPNLIEAVKEINLTLVMVGKAITETNYDKLNPWNKDLNLVNKMTEGDKRFIKLGYIPTQDLSSLYNLATVFVFPSIYEGFGLPVIEAMQSGCPVVLSKEGCLKELGAEAVYYINPFNINNIANGIGEVYYSRKLQKSLSQKGLEQAKKFSWQKTAQDTIKIYQNALRKS